MMLATQPSILLGLAVSLLTGSVAAEASGSLTNGCKAHPGDKWWPKHEAWARLNESTEYNLVQPPPPGGVCHAGQSNYDAAKCPEVSTAWMTTDFHIKDPLSVMLDQFANDTCLPDAKDPCSSAGYPAYAVRATKTEHVKAAIDFARQRNVRLNVRSTGHDFLGRSNSPGSLSIWLHHLDSIVHHAGEFTLAGSSRLVKGSAVTVGGGTILQKIYEETATYNETIVGGLSRTVGVGGFVTGGGHSAFSPKHGLAADNILQMEVVTADGQIRIANQDQNADLFWALRGGGGSTFGVITSMTMKTFPSPQVTQVGLVALAQIDDPILPDLIGYLASQTEYLMNAGISGYSYVGHRLPNPLPGSGLPDPLAGMIGKLIAQDTSVEDIHAIFKPLNDTILQRWKGKALLFLVPKVYPTALDWLEDNYDEDPTGHSVWLVSRLLGSEFLHRDEKEVGKVLWDASGALGRLALFFLGGKGVQNVQPSGGNSVNPAWRKAYIHSYGAKVFEPFNKTASDEAVKSVDEAFQPIREMSPSSGAYLNEALPFEHDWQHTFWGSNYERLVQIKREVDPRDVFWCAPCVGNERWAQRGDGRLCRK